MTSRQTRRLKRIAIQEAIRSFMIGEDGIAGTALIEFTILAPLVVIMSIYTMDFGLLLFNKIQLQNAAQAGAQWVMANRIYNSSAVQAAVQNSTTYNPSQIRVPLRVCPQYTSYQFCGCPSTTGVTQISAGPCSGGVGQTCSGGAVAGTYACIYAEPKNAYTSFLPYGLLSGTQDVSATATVRIQ